MDYLNLVKGLVAQEEGPCLEFKKDNERPDMIGERISALSNGAVLEGTEGSFMLWGFDDATHTVIGSGFYPYKAKKGNEDLINWLTRSLDNVEFRFRDLMFEGKHVVVLAVYPAAFYPATFQNNIYVREGSHTKPILKLPEVQKRLWALLNTRNHETTAVATDLTMEQALFRIDLSAMVSMMRLPTPTSLEATADLLVKTKVLRLQSDGLYSLTLMGGLLFARDLTQYDLLMSRTVRIIRYDGTSRSRIQRQFECKKGYAVQFDELMNYISLLLPSEDRIVNGIMTTFTAYPPDAVREVLVNAMMHQDLTDPSRHILVEVFDGRVEVSNPGKLMVDPLRIVDWMPEERNRQVGVLMRSMRMCESLGSGWDRIVELCEGMYLPAPDIETEETFTKVVLHTWTPFMDMSRKDRIWATYLHACRMHEAGSAVTNATLRNRFGLDSGATSAVSRVLTWTGDEGLIKQVDDGSGKRNRRYVPFWA